MRKLGYGENYLYPHDYEGAVTDQTYRPEKLEGRLYYSPSERGYEARLREYLDRVRKIRAQLRREAEPNEFNDAPASNAATTRPFSKEKGK
jgi:replication-associated recombination protein RarA